jgi:AraC-like DNA-binding protein
MATRTPMPASVTLDRGWRLLVLDLGLDLDEVARRAGIAPHLVWEESFRVTVAQYLAMARVVEAMSGDPLLALRMAEAWNPGAFSPVFFAAMCSSTLTVALERIATHKRLVAPVRLQVRRTREGIEVTWAWDDPTLDLPHLLIATELVLMVQIARLGLRQPIRPLRVRTPIPLKPAKPYEAFFGVRPTLADKPALVFSTADAERPFVTASAALWSTFEPDLRRRTHALEAEMEVSDRVRSALFECVPSGEATIDGVAAKRGMSGRTLQRRLASEAASFRGLVQETRQRLALHYLHRTKLPYGEICEARPQEVAQEAHALAGFSEVAAHCFTCGAEPHDRCDVLRARTHSSLVTGAQCEGDDGCSALHEERANALGCVEFVACNGEEIDAQRTDVHRHFADRLRSIRVDECTDRAGAHGEL